MFASFFIIAENDAILEVLIILQNDGVVIQYHLLIRSPMRRSLARLSLRSFLVLGGCLVDLAQPFGNSLLGRDSGLLLDRSELPDEVLCLYFFEPFVRDVIIGDLLLN